MAGVSSGIALDRPINAQFEDSEWMLGLSPRVLVVYWIDRFGLRFRRKHDVDIRSVAVELRDERYNVAVGKVFICCYPHEFFSPGTQSFLHIRAHDALAKKLIIQREPSVREIADNHVPTNEFIARRAAL